MDNYEKIIHANLDRLYKNLPENLERLLPGQRQTDKFRLKALGQSCQIRPDGVCIGEEPATGGVGILITLYALHAGEDPCMPTPFKAFREFPNSQPYVGAFASHTEQVLLGRIDGIEQHAGRIARQLRGSRGSDNDAGDFSLILYPLPKIALTYVFYRADEDFPASVTCLFSNNAAAFLPTDALADTGEYTSKKILEIL